MSSRRRDRHRRGLRGPLATPTPLLGRAVEVPRRLGKADFFTEAVQQAVERVRRHQPEVIAQIRIGIEDVPHLTTAWSGDRVPLAAAIDPTPDRPGQVVVYRRPLEHRAASRRGLRILVHRTIVEQLAAVTGRTVDDIDPETDDPDD